MSSKYEINKESYREPLFNKSTVCYKKINVSDRKKYLDIQPQSPPKKVSFKNGTKIFNVEDTPTNKFDAQYQINNSLYKKFNSRKYSRDSANDSTSYEDFYEKEVVMVSTPPRQKNKVPFKSNASDFKIKYKTELCKYFEINGTCKFGDNCAYAHGKENLRSKVTNSTAYRTRNCREFFEHGYCPYGNRCQFAHQLKSNIINNPYDRTMTYKTILDTISKLENVENIKKLIEKPRLEVFKEIIDDKQQEHCESRLLDDIKSINKSDIFERISND